MNPACSSEFSTRARLKQRQPSCKSCTKGSSCSLPSWAKMRIFQAGSHVTSSPSLSNWRTWVMRFDFLQTHIRRKTFGNITLLEPNQPKDFQAQSQELHGELWRSNSHWLEKSSHSSSHKVPVGLPEVGQSKWIVWSQVASSVKRWGTS